MSTLGSTKVHGRMNKRTDVCISIPGKYVFWLLHNPKLKLRILSHSQSGEEEGWRKRYRSLPEGSSVSTELVSNPRNSWRNCADAQIWLNTQGSCVTALMRRLIWTIEFLIRYYDIQTEPSTFSLEILCSGYATRWGITQLAQSSDAYAQPVKVARYQNFSLSIFLSKYYKCTKQSSSKTVLMRRHSWAWLVNYAISTKIQFAESI